MVCLGYWEMSPLVGSPVGVEWVSWGRTEPRRHGGRGGGFFVVSISGVKMTVNVESLSDVELPEIREFCMPQFRGVLACSFAGLASEGLEY